MVDLTNPVNVTDMVNTTMSNNIPAEASEFLRGFQEYLPYEALALLVVMLLGAYILEKIPFIGGVAKLFIYVVMAVVLLLFLNFMGLLKF